MTSSTHIAPDYFKPTSLSVCCPMRVDEETVAR